MNSNLDPNPNFFTANSELLSNCIYLTSREFNKIPFPPDAFSAFHINIRSLPKHFDDLSEYLLSLNNMLFSVVAASETWSHKSNSDLLNIPGYHFISNSREHKLGGGVGLYIQSDMNFKPRIDLQSSDNSLYESVFVEIMRPHGKNIIVGCLYTPPVPLSMILTGLLKISCQPSVLRISYLIPREARRGAPSREVYNLVAREGRVYHRLPSTTKLWVFFLKTGCFICEL